MREWLARHYGSILALIPVAAATWAYWHVLEDGFETDDFYHLYTMANHGFVRFVLTPHGGHALVLRNLIFYVLYRLFGVDPSAYFVTVLVTHVAATYLLHLVVQRLTGRHALACLAALLWGTAPIHEGALGWYSVYGHVLSATIAFWILADLARFRQGHAVPTGARVASWYVVAIAGMTTFGTGIVPAMLLAPVAFLLLPPSPKRWRIVGFLATSVVVAPLVYVALHRVFTAMYGVGAVAPDRVVSLAMNDVRALVDMVVLLVLWGAGSVLFPGQQYGTGEHPAQAAALIALGLATLVAFVVASPKTRRDLLGVLLLAGATYGLIALGRAHVIQLMHGTIAWAASLPRYHYLGSGLLCIAVSIVVHALWSAGITTRVPVCAAAAGWLLWLATVPAERIVIPPVPDGMKEMRKVLALVDAAVDSVGNRPRVYIENKPFVAIGAALAPTNPQSPIMFPGRGAIFILANPTNEVRGKTVYFVEKDPRVLAGLRADPNARSAQLFVDEANALAAMY